MSVRSKLLGALAVVGLVGGGYALHSGAAPVSAAPSALTDSSIPDVAERTVDSVVNISSTTRVRGGPAQTDPFYNDPDSPSYGEVPERRMGSKGSGVIVTASGRILTNA